MLPKGLFSERIRLCRVGVYSAEVSGWCVDVK